MRTYGEKIKEMIEQNRELLKQYGIEDKNDYICVVGQVGFVLVVKEVFTDGFYAHGLGEPHALMLYPALPCVLLDDDMISQKFLKEEVDEKIN